MHRELFYVSLDNEWIGGETEVADSLEPFVPRELFPLPIPDAGLIPYNVEPDGQHFLAPSTQQQAAQSLTVITNWPQNLNWH